MEDIPPSYHQSTNPSVLDIIAPYLVTLSLHALTLVSRSHNAVFMPHLWGSPASHFVPMAEPTAHGVSVEGEITHQYDELVYQALTRFKRVLKFARLSTRSLVHTLYLPPANSEIYSGPNATWLRDILDGLPNLQSLCVGGLPFLDHNSMIAVDRRRSSAPPNECHTYPLKLLLASKESNVTSIGLSLFLPHFSHLVYLDLSSTSPARDVNVLSSLSALTDLRILKLRGVGMRDNEAEVLANAIGLRVRLLDVAHNLLSDNAVRSLLQACFMHKSDEIEGSQNAIPNPLNVRLQLESWPVGLPPSPDFFSLDTMRSASFDKDLLVQLTNPLTGRLAFEDIPHTGLTHLYITDNPAVTVEGVKSLLSTGRLHVLDAGEIAGETVVDRYVQSAIDRGRWHGRARSMTSSASLPSREDFISEIGDEDDGEIHFPGAEKLITILREEAQKNLTYLRIDHALVTKKLPFMLHASKPQAHPGHLDLSHGPVELNADLEVTRVEVPGSMQYAVEMPADPSVFELDATPSFRAELPGDFIHVSVSPPVSHKTDDETTSPLPTQPIRGEGPYAPEVAMPCPVEPSVTLFGQSIAQRRGLAPATCVVPQQLEPEEANRATGPLPRPVLQPLLSPFSDKQMQIAALLERRQSRHLQRLDPASLPNLRTLILVNVPSNVHVGSSIITGLKEFISACAAEAHLAQLQAKTDYSLPPGRARIAAEREHARSLFALSTIVLEVVPTSDIQLGRSWKDTGNGPQKLKSASGDHDSEALWSAADNDFSFFGEHGEEHDEMGIYDHEPGKYFPRVSFDDKFFIQEEDTTLSPSPGTVFSWSNTTRSIDQFNNGSPPPSALLKSPRELPLGRNRRSIDGPPVEPTPPVDQITLAEAVGSVPLRRTQQAPTSAPLNLGRKKPPLRDVVAEVAEWRKERKAAFAEELRRRSRINGVTMLSATRVAESEAYVEGHWKGSIQVVRKNTRLKASTRAKGSEDGRLERTGMVDMYGNYFERGYLYS